MNGTSPGVALPTELAALALVFAGLALIVGLRRLACAFLVAVVVCALAVPLLAQLSMMLPAPLRLVLFGLGAMMAMVAVLRLLLGRRVWELVLAHVISHGVIVVLGGLLRSTAMKAVLLVIAGGCALWLLNLTT